MCGAGGEAGGGEDGGLCGCGESVSAECFGVQCLKVEFAEGGRGVERKGKKASMDIWSCGFEMYACSMCGHGVEKRTAIRKEWLGHFMGFTTCLFQR